MDNVISEISDLISDLKKRVEGEVRFDKYSKILYSTDASIYEIEPIGVVIPKTESDVVETIKVAATYKVPILPRGAGTSLAGQAVGKAIHIDMSKYLNQILEVNAEERWVRVQPGVVLDELNTHLKPLGLQFAPDVATSNRANVGGMIGNNSSGAHSIIYGKTVDHVKELHLILSNGAEADFIPISLSSGQLQAKQNQNDLEGEIYRAIPKIVSENCDEIIARFPKILRRVGGYNLDEFLEAGVGCQVLGVRENTNTQHPTPNTHFFNLSKLIVGSEGTLAAVTQAKLNLVTRPKMTALDLVHFSDLIEAMEATNVILTCEPSAIELVDKMILDLTKDSLEYSRRMNFVQGDPRAILSVEFYGESEAELKSKVEKLEAKLKAQHLGYAFVRAFDPTEQANIWKVRKAGLGLLLGMKGDKKPIAFVEDTAVSPEKLPEYISRFDQIVKAHDTEAAYYAHASVGCLHVRPLINLKEASEVKKMKAIAEQVSDLVLEFGGAMSGEHGDGLARSCWNEKMFGPKLYEAFKQVKKSFDPNWIMNPGKIVEAPFMTENLRYGESYKTIEIQTHLSFAREGGFDRAIELCNGAGVCKKKLEGTMCPSYMVTREEEHSTRGRANALRAAISGKFPLEDFTSQRMYEVLDLCLECKGCKAECPSNVDMAKLKYEFLAHYYEKHGTPLRAKLFANIQSLNQIGCALAPFSNWAMSNRLSKWTLEKIGGVDSRRHLPSFANQTFPKWFKSRTRHHVATSRRDVETFRRNVSTEIRGKAVLFNDTFMNYNVPEIGKAATILLEHLGFEVTIVEKKCCGRPMISKGMLEKARENAKYNVELLAKYCEDGYVILGCEPSCILTLRDEYLDLVSDERAKLVAQNSFMIDEFLWNLYKEGKLDTNVKFAGENRKVLFHGHCHQKAHIGTTPSVQLLKQVGGFEVIEIDSGCCGMAGSFGYEKEHYEISMAIGNRCLFPTIEAQKGKSDFLVAAPGISCRQQIYHATKVRALHPVELLVEALRAE